MIIAVDFDNTLYINKQINLPLIRKLKSMQNTGNPVILWTCREGQRLREALMLLRQVGFIPNAVNDNVPEGIKRMGYNSRKVLADIYIDDKEANA